MFISICCKFHIVIFHKIWGLPFKNKILEGQMKDWKIHKKLFCHIAQLWSTGNVWILIYILYFVHKYAMMIMITMGDINYMYIQDVCYAKYTKLSTISYVITHQSPGVCFIVDWLTQQRMWSYLPEIKLQQNSYKVA